MIPLVITRVRPIGMPLALIQRLTKIYLKTLSLPNMISRGIIVKNLKKILLVTMTTREMRRRD